MTKTIKGLLVLAPWLVAGLAMAQPRKCVLVRDGAPMARVQTVSSSPVVQFAAEELQRYVSAMSGADLGAVGEGDGECAVTLALDPSLGWDAYSVTVARKRILVTGGNERGVLYGVYQILEDLGVRFLALGPEGENVPLRSTLSLRAGKKTYRPALRYRGVIVQLSLTERHLQMADWMAKNRMNYWVNPHWALGTNVELRQRWVDALEERGILWEFGHHTFAYWITQGAQEPELLCPTSANRAQPAICIGDPLAAEKVAGNMAAFAARWPQVDVLSLWPNDEATSWCEADACRWPYGDTPPGRNGAPIMTGPYFWFLGQVSESLVQRGVRQPFTALAYNNTLEPVAGLTFPENLLVTVAPILRSYTVPIASLDYFGPVMAQWTTLLGESSQQTGARVMAYEYYAGMYANNSLPFPTVTALADDIERYRQTGFGGITTQAEEGHWGIYGLNFHALARMSYHGARDPRRLIADFSRDYYGSAAAPMTEYWTRQEELIRAQGSVLPNGQFFRVLHGTAGEIDALDRLVEQAESLADSDVVRSRVRLTRLSVDYVKLLRDAIDIGKGTRLDVLPPTPKGTGTIPPPDKGEFVQLRLPIVADSRHLVSLRNIVPVIGAGSSYQLEVRRDGPGGPVVTMGKVFSGSPAEAAQRIPGRAWTDDNRRPIDITPHLTDADISRGYVDLFATAHVTGDTWTLYRDTDDGGTWDIGVQVASYTALQDREAAWQRLKSFVEQHAHAGIFNSTTEFVLSQCRKMVDAYP